MPSDKQNAEFMYAMLKQLDLKYIDWAAIAAANNITNGHAARMRFTRYRQAMEGLKAGGGGSKNGSSRSKGCDDKSSSSTTGGSGKKALNDGGKKRKRAEDWDESVDDDEDDEEEGKGRPLARRVKVEKKSVKNEEADVPVRKRAKRGVKMEAELESKPDFKREWVREERKGSVLDSIPPVKVEMVVD